MKSGHTLFLTVLAAVCLPAAGRAQQGPPRVRREIRGFDFRKDGVWRKQARAVRSARQQLLGQRNFPALNAPLVTEGRAPRVQGAPLAAGPVVSGVLRVPAILFRFKNTPASEIRPTSQFDDVLFAPAPTGASAGRPYTYASYYAELSNGLLTVQGQTYGYAALDSNEVNYTGVPGTCSGNPYPGSTDCNGLFSPNARARMQSGLTEALRKLDSQIDWTLYDSDGDGFVDLVAFMQPALDGACGPKGNNHLWSHRFALGPYVTHSTTVVNGQTVNVKVADYILESGVGGASGCDTTAIMPIGTVAHETGHGFGLPDLYDTDGASEGVGEFSLMGSGNYTSPSSPSRMDVWSLNELGWVIVTPLTTGGAYRFGPAKAGVDTALFVPVGGSNPRGEYFLLENRQGVLSDSAMIRYHCRVWYASANPPTSCGGGLIVWHVDSAQVADGLNTPGPNNDFNHVNVGSIHGLEPVQADGFGNLDADPASRCYPGAPLVGCSDRGDAGDLYPGTTGNTTLSNTTLPSDDLNSTGCPGFSLDTISQIAPNGAVRFVLNTGPQSLAVTTASPLPGGLWGYAYNTVITAACGSGTYTWTVTSGAPPPGVTFSQGGVLSGWPTDTGTYTFQVGVTDGTQTTGRGMTLHIAEPALTLQQVLNLEFQGQVPANDDQTRYLDLQGNHNNTFDIGDFLRWLVRTGQVAAAGPAVTAARVRP
ncbi:MAG TPA: M6 family metalloprotease domain-containing protein [Gemmatimonadales bacterium]|nr:M6 family metalloprotease domain-containing protein [Gemmatimonadales bacterium]